MILHYLLIVIFIFIVALWTIFIGNWTIGKISSSSAPSSIQYQTQTNQIPVQYQPDKIAFVDSIITLGKAGDLTQPVNGIAGPADNSEQVLSLVDQALASSTKVRDEFLDYLDPKLKEMYRNKLIMGARIWQEGIKTDDLQKQLQGIKLNREWINWFDANKDKVGNKIF